MQPARILIVSCDTELIHAVKRAFPEGPSLQPSVSHSVKDACARVQRDNVALVLVDLAEGAREQDLLPLVWAVNSARRACCVLALTRRPNDDLRTALLRAG